MCSKCGLDVMPCSLRPLENRSPIRDDSDRPPHQQHLCDKCKKLGRNCREYTPQVTLVPFPHGPIIFGYATDKDVAEEDEIPDEEDAESVITTNSSVFPDNEDDTRSSSSRTPINSDDDDYCLDDVEEKISKLNI